MLDLDSWQEIGVSLARNKLRTALTAFGVFWGLFMLVVLLGSGRGLENGALGAFGSEATNSFFVWTQRTSQPYRGLPPGRSFALETADTEAIARRADRVDVVTPRSQLGGYRGGNNVNRGNRAGTFNVMGDTPLIRQIVHVPMLEGRFLNELDLSERRKVAVIGTRVRDLLFEPGEDPIGDAVRIRGVYFKVVGLFGPSSEGEQGEQDSETIYVPFSTFQVAFNQGDDVGWFALTPRPGVPASAAIEQVIPLLAERHQVAPNDPRAFGHWNNEVNYNRTLGLFSGIRLLVWIVGVGTLAAGVIGVSNIMLIIVKERTREIGMRRAIGATPLNVIGQIVLESIVLTSVSGYLGMLAGVALVEGTRIVLDRQGATVGAFQAPGVELYDVLLALTILVVAGAIAGLLPARRAVAVRPVEALRAE